jgi:hypothetical protein
MKGFGVLIVAMVAIALQAGTASAALGAIAIFRDAAGTNCNITDAPSGYAPVYMFHVYTTGAKGSEFKLVVPAGWTHLGDIEQFEATVGTPLEGVSIEYGACRTGNFLVYQSNFLGDGSSPVCSATVRIVASPNAASGRVEGVDCEDVTRVMTVENPWVNSDGTCFCGQPPCETTTWGQVKALFD